jgi:hypothetical protein
MPVAVEIRNKNWVVARPPGSKGKHMKLQFLRRWLRQLRRSAAGSKYGRPRNLPEVQCWSATEGGADPMSDQHLKAIRYLWQNRIGTKMQRHPAWVPDSLEEAIPKLLAEIDRLRMEVSTLRTEKDYFRREREIYVATLTPK